MLSSRILSQKTSKKCFKYSRKLNIIGLLLSSLIIAVFSLIYPNKVGANCASQNYCGYYSDFKYLEQKYIFGIVDNNKEQQVISDFENIPYPLSKEQIQDLSRLITGETSVKLADYEIESLYKIQSGRNKYQFIKSIILAVHQHTGALAGGAGVHVRISAESPNNQSTNIKALLKVLSKVQPGNRIVVVDLIKASGDLNKLLDPNYQSLGLVDNHETGFKNFISQIKQSGYENRIMLMVRIDGSSSGANEDISNPDKAYKYELTIKKIINYLELTLPNMPVKVILGNEPDLYVERQWSPNETAAGQARIDFIIKDYAPKIGSFIKKLALSRPDVAFITPGLSADFKNLNKQYFSSLYGDFRSDNMVANFHGYSADVAYIDGGGKNLIHLKSDELRTLGIKNYIISELGSGNGFRDSEYFLDKAKFDDTAIWIMLSTKHDFRGQDANWAFFVDPDNDSYNANELANLVNRTNSKIITNILDRTNQNLPILDTIVKPSIKNSLPKDITANANYNNIYFGPDNIYLAFDGDPNTRWASRNSQQKDMKFEIDLKKVYRINKITVNNTNYKDDQPSKYNIKVSSNGLIFTNIASKENSKIDVSDINKNARYIIIEQTGSKSNWWSIDELDLDYGPEDSSLPSDHEPPAVTNYNTIYNGPDNILNAFDKVNETRWSSEAKQEPGMYFEINLGAVRKIKGLKLDNSGSPLDYPRGYKVYASTTRTNYALISQNPNNTAPVDVNFSETDAKYIKVEQTSHTDDMWWSIHEVDIKYKDSTPTPSTIPTVTPIITPVPTETPTIVTTPTVVPSNVGQNNLWTLKIFANKNLSGEPIKTRQDIAILSNGVNYDWGWGTAEPDKMPFYVNDFSIRFEKNIMFNNKFYKFFAIADDGVRVFVDGNIILDKWNNSNANTINSSNSYNLSGVHNVKIEYYEASDVAKVKVWYEETTVNPTITPTVITTISPTPHITPTPVITVPVTVTPTPVSSSMSTIIFNAKGTKDKDVYPKIKVMVDHENKNTEIAEKSIDEEKDYVFESPVKLTTNDKVIFYYCNDTSDDGKCENKAGGANRDLIFNYVIIDNKKLSFNKEGVDIKYDRANKEDGSKYDWGNYRDVTCTDGDFGKYNDGKALLKGGERLQWGVTFDKQLPWNGAIIAKINW